MARGNFNNQTKRKRELAKKDKRAAKDEKGAQKKAAARVARGGADGAAAPSIAVRTSVTTPVAVSSWRSLAATAFIRRMNKTP
jgi:hypothetical protein